MTALRLRLSVAPDSGLRDSIKNELLAYIRAHPGHCGFQDRRGRARQGIHELHAEPRACDRAKCCSFRPDDARHCGVRARTVPTPGLITPADRISYAQVLGAPMARTTRTRSSTRLRGRWLDRRGVQRARHQAHGGAGYQTRATLRDIAARFAGDQAAPPALYLQADLTTDDGNDADARALYRRCVYTYPSTVRPRKTRASVRLRALVGGGAPRGGPAFDSLVTLYPRSDRSDGRAILERPRLAQAGDATTAEARWRRSSRSSPRRTTP